MTDYFLAAPGAVKVFLILLYIAVLFVLGLCMYSGKFGKITSGKVPMKALIWLSCTYYLVTDFSRNAGAFFTILRVLLIILELAAIVWLLFDTKDLSFAFKLPLALLLGFIPFTVIDLVAGLSFIVGVLILIIGGFVLFEMT